MWVILLYFRARNLVSMDRIVIVVSRVFKKKHYHAQFPLKWDMNIRLLFVSDDDFLNSVELLKRI